MNKRRAVSLLLSLVMVFCVTVPLSAAETDNVKHTYIGTEYFHESEVKDFLLAALDEAIGWAGGLDGNTVMEPYEREDGLMCLTVLYKSGVPIMATTTGGASVSERADCCRSPLLTGFLMWENHIYSGEDNVCQNVEYACYFYCMSCMTPYAQHIIIRTACGETHGHVNEEPYKPDAMDIAYGHKYLHRNYGDYWFLSRARYNALSNGDYTVKLTMRYNEEGVETPAMTITYSRASQQWHYGYLPSYLADGIEKCCNVQNPHTIILGEWHFLNTATGACEGVAVCVVDMCMNCKTVHGDATLTFPACRDAHK